MKNFFSLVLMLFFCGVFLCTPALHAEDQKRDWSSSYNSFRRHFRSLSQTEVAYCEKLLQEILDDLDTKNQCNASGTCVLIDQEPFGATVPFPKSLSAFMKSRMKKYYQYCDDGFSHSFKNNDLINNPVCLNGTCTVKTRLRRGSSK
jgi:hypothetical protein